METDRERAEDADPATYVSFEKYCKIFANNDEEEMDVNCIGLSSHS